ncbi:MAG: pyridoxine 5'-phosphate synthase [Flavobacteriales bacterium]|jgi:pyridoxine 5-phosphate synthase|nr:pyridoxine 5'-phosphate synthase [Flavobacteriaceae bacterium]RZP06480.1 MAG: pyridoxine 5'-phosphate synthase [Flavobacteriales bacterium]|tara:strand:- start:4916 stop:5638 length:723 start_codon:yes stop_codon:yes gene_type:complete
MTKLSVNINKIATLRNSRGADFPNLINFAKRIQSYGAEGITVHPRPDERHIRYSDIYDLKSIVYKEFNIEGNPINKFIDLVIKNKPDQVTLVPDAESDLTSCAGWNTIKHKNYLKEVVSEFNSNGIRTSIFLDPDVKYIESLSEIGADRIEFYTEAYAKNYGPELDRNKKAIEPYVICAKYLNQMGIGINAGHDLALDNIKFFKNNIENLLEVSIGHALIVESLELGIETVIKKYLTYLK